MDVIRERYLDIMSAGMGKTDLAKVLTGMRRVGKSTILGQYVEKIKSSGVDEDMIFQMNFDVLGHDIDNVKLNGMLNDFLVRKGIHYIFLDEIQNVKDWELTVAMLIARKDCDVYLTGSNSNMLSSELSTRLSGRYMKIEILPFSFSEFLSYNPGDRYERFDDYLRYGSLPVIEMSRGTQICYGHLESIFDTVLVKDVLSHVRTDDVNKIVKIARFLYDNVGNMTNIDNISKELKINNVTVDKYVSAMVAAHLFYYCERYDIVGKKIFKTNGKYYATDLGMRRVCMGNPGNSDISRPIENIVYLELLRRGYTVRVGSFRDSEVDFTVSDYDKVSYYQVTETMMSDKTRDREFGPLESIDDNFPKTILTLDRIGLGTHKGINVVNLIDWLLDGQ